MDAALLSRRLSGAAILLGHFGRNGIMPIALHKKCRRLIGPKICFADEDSHDDNDIMEKNVRKRTWVEESLAISMVRPPMVTHAVARCSVQFLQRHFVEQGFSDNIHVSLDVCGDLILC